MEKKLTVIQMAQHLGVSKEAIYNRIRRGSLQSVVENGKKYVLLTDKQKNYAKQNRTSFAHNNEYTQHLKQELEELKAKNQKLENDKERLQQEKDELLESTRIKIEAIYKSRDEYIQSILSLLNVPSLSEKPHEEIVEVDESQENVEDEEVDIVDQICESFENWVELKEYLSSKDYTKKEAKDILKKVYANLGKSKFLKESRGEIFIKKGIKLKKILNAKK